MIKQTPLNLSSNQSKFIVWERDKTRSSENLSKLCENCRILRDDLEAEIFSLKDKSHQSFMQVIQVQQLHEEEIEIIKLQHQDEISQLKQKIAHLKAENQNLQKEASKNTQLLKIMEKNSKRHIWDLDQPSFLIENIEMIDCKEEGQEKSRLDESSLDQFNSIVETPSQKLLYTNNNENEWGTNSQLLLTKGQVEVGSQKQLAGSSSKAELEQKASRLGLRILELESEVESLWETNQELKRECLKLQASEKSLKHNYDSLYKESKFMADHIRTLANDKFKLERRLKELDKEIKELKSHPPTSNPHSKQSHFQNDKHSHFSLKINASEVFTNQDLDNVRNSLENSTENIEKPTYHKRPQSANKLPPSTLPQTVSVNELNKPKQPEMIMSRSEMFGQNSNQAETRKSMPNYKKVSHISPSLKKVSVSKAPQKEKEEKLQSQKFKGQNDGSDFMQEIRREVELKASLKKSSGQGGFNQQGHKAWALQDNWKKRSSAK